MSYRVLIGAPGVYGPSYHVVTASGRLVDTMRTPSGAEHGAQMLTVGAAVEDTSAAWGRRIIPKTLIHHRAERDALLLSGALDADDDDLARAANTVERLSHGTIGTL